MFADLLKWKEQSYYDEHQIMWLLTPEMNYKVVLIAGYLTAYDSDAYVIYKESGEQMDSYLDKCIRLSDFRTDVELIPEACYIMLSTCTNVYDSERYVLHGMLVPVGSEDK